MSDSLCKIIKKAVSVLVIIAVVSAAYMLPVHADEEDTVIITVPEGYDENVLEIELDGVPVTPHPTDNSNEYSITVNSNSKFITAFKYSGDVTNGNSYPVNMAVWEIDKTVTYETPEGGGFSGTTGDSGEPETIEVVTYSAKRLEGFDDVLGYDGFAIKPPTSEKSGGIRCSLSIPTDIKENGLVIDDSTEYTVEEYGHLHILSRNWNSSSKYNMRYNDQLVLKASCYVKGRSDHILRVEGDRTIFANSLYDIVDYNVVKHFRGYIRLHKAATNEDVYLYGPVVGRNPYYVAKRAAENTNESASIRAFAAEVKAIVEGDTSDPGNPATASEKINAFFIGDSIMMGMTLKDGISIEHGPDTYTNYKQVSRPPSVLIGNGLADKLSRQVDCTLIANGGATYSEPGVNLYNMPDMADTAIQTAEEKQVTPDYIFLMAGVNDWAYQDQGEGSKGNSAVFGVNHEGRGIITNEFEHLDNPYSATDKSYCIGVDRTVKKLSEKYPDAKIIVCSPVRAWWDSGPGTTTINRSTGRNLNEYCYVQGSVARHYREDLNKNVYFINLYDDILGPMGLPTYEGSEPEKGANFRKYFPDGYHPNQSGYNIISDVVIKDMGHLGLF